ncbi:MAG: glycosyltransferase family 4 protein [Chitinispirillaceae bacterium]|nr:glycosyltransferase family 4 protein [Chitinispirillaceae bacterium]
MINLSTPVAFGGGEALFVLVAKELAKRNIQVVQVNLTKSKKFEEVLKKENIEFLTVSKFDLGYSPSKFNYIKVLFNLIPVILFNNELKILLREAETIHTHGFPTNFILYLLKALGFISNRSVLVYSHHSLKSPHCEPIRSIYKKILSIYHVIIGVSSKTSDSLVRVFPELKNKIINVPNGIDIDKFNISKPRDEIRADLELPKDDVLGIYVARFAPVKNHSFLIKLVKAINYDKFRILLLGDGGERDFFFEKAKKEGVLNRLIWRGSVENSLVPCYLKASDFYLHPALAEGFSISILEAMASRLPVVVFENVYTEELGKAVLVSKDEGEFIDHVKKLILEPDFRNTLDAEAGRTAEKLSIQGTVDKYLDTLQRIVKINIKGKT